MDRLLLLVQTQWGRDGFDGGALSEPLEETENADYSRQWRLENAALNQEIVALKQAALMRDVELTQSHAALTQSHAELVQHKAELALLKLQLQTLRRLKFGRSAERFDPAHGFERYAATPNPFRQG